MEQIHLKRHPLKNSKNHLRNDHHKYLEVFNQVIKKVKIDAPIYDGIHDLNKFL